MKKLFTFFMTVMLFGFVANAQNFTINESNDTIDVNTTWSYDTVFMDINACILDDVVLTIDPGSVIMFNDFYKIILEGSLIAEGTEADSIFFTVADTTGFSDHYNHIGWDGIEISDSNGDMMNNTPSSFDYCKFMYAKEMNDWYGGGVFIIQYYKHVTILNSVFMYNYALEMGGAIGIQEEAEALIDNCSFLYNASDYGGGAIHIGCYDDSDNSSSPIIKNSYFYGNMSFYDGYYGGAAIKTSSYATTQIINNVIVNNHAVGDAGAILASGYGNPYIIGNVIAGNTSGSKGGGIKVAYHSSPYIANNTIVGNTATDNGGGIMSGCNDGTLTVKNNIISGNTDSTSTGGNVFLTVSGTDREFNFYNNNIEFGFEGIYIYGDEFVGQYLDNIDEEPLFVDADNGDYRLQVGSPCINVGDNNVQSLPFYDINGAYRIIDETIDMGAFEYNPYSGISSINENTMFMSPNPAVNFVNISMENSQTGTIQINDLSGRLIYTSQIKDNKHRINTSGFAKGIYLVKINSEGKSSAQKLIIQ